MDMDNEDVKRQLLGRLFKNFQSFMEKNASEKWDAHGPLTKEDEAEWDSIHNKIAEIDNMAHEVKARKDLFWAVLQRKTGLFDKELKIEGGVLYIKQEVTGKEDVPPSPDLDLPPDCDGNCDTCDKAGE